MIDKDAREVIKKLSDDHSSTSIITFKHIGSLLYTKVAYGEDDIPRFDTTSLVNEVHSSTAKRRFHIKTS